MDLIREITIVFSVAGILGIFFSFLRLPLILAYLATGLVIGKFGFNLIPLQGDISGLSDLGIAFMLFLVGLELDIQKIRSQGISIFIIGLVQIGITFLTGFFIAYVLGLGSITSVYLGLALAFSSTVIVVKYLSDQNEIASLHGRTLVGVLLIQDFIAIIALLILQGLGGDNFNLNQILLTISYAALFGIVAYLIRKYIIKYIFNLFSNSMELIFVASIAWALLLASLAESLSFSPFIGAFIAGVTLAPLTFSDEIRGRIRWLRDFFIVLFLSLIGASLATQVSIDYIPLIVLFSVLAIIAKPIIITLIMGIMGYRRRISFLTGLYLSQISEFSLIIAAIGISLNHINDTIAAIIMFIALISMAVSSVLMAHGSKLFHFLSGPLKLFERNGNFIHDFENVNHEFRDHVVLFGANRVGHPVLQRLRAIGHTVLVVDFDPNIIKHLRSDNIEAIYGDMGDPDLIDKLNLEKAKMMISTTHSFLDTELILKKTNHVRNNILTFVTANTAIEALELYKLGADYVILPQHLSGEFLADLINNIKDNAPKTTARQVIERRERHIKELNKFIAKDIPG